MAYGLHSQGPSKVIALVLDIFACLGTWSDMFYVLIVFHNIVQLHDCVFVLYLESNMGLHYLTFMKKNDVGSNSKNVMNSVSIVNDSVAMNSSFKV
jgi:hypothetical protein